jgi:hypothetical protein
MRQSKVMFPLCFISTAYREGIACGSERLDDCGQLRGLFGCGDGMSQISSHERQQDGYRQKKRVQQPEVE